MPAGRVREIAPASMAERESKPQPVKGGVAKEAKVVSAVAGVMLPRLSSGGAAPASAAARAVTNFSTYLPSRSASRFTASPTLRSRRAVTS